MAEFIVNCNLCLLRYSPNVSFYVTTCGHMKCEPCTAKSDDKTKCAVCKSPAQLIPINNNLNPEMLPFFRPLSYSVDQAKQISKFQDQNKTIIIKNLKNKCKFVKGEMVKCYGALHDLKRENASLHLQLQVISIESLIFKVTFAEYAESRIWKQIGTEQTSDISYIRLFGVLIDFFHSAECSRKQPHAIPSIDDTLDQFFAYRNSHERASTV
uniref:RING-type domain-containing protein n=1 Tax=Photinus pyralis TaxID=7054 RepID=A0A1Y1N005_PHOPY